MTATAWAAIEGLGAAARDKGVKIPAEDRLIFHVEVQRPQWAARVVTDLRARFPEAKVAPLFAEAVGDTARFVELTFSDVHAELAAPVAYAAAYDLVDTEPGVVSAEPDLPAHVYIEPDDPVAGQPGAESAIVKMFCKVDGDPPENTLWAIDMIRVKPAMDYSRAKGRPAGGKGVTVAQPDTGVCVNAELEAGAVLDGWNLFTGQPGAEDPLPKKGNPGHGTATGSCVVSRPTGRVHGSAPEAKLYPIRAVESVIVTRAGPVAKAIERAILAKAQVVTMSLGGVPSRAVRAVIRRARTEGLIVMAAAGNCVKLVVWPARYPECLAVAGCNISRLPWKGTSRGASVDITAPGEQVWHASAKEPKGYKDGQGTSFAVALTAGAAAQWLAHHGPDEIATEAETRGVVVHDLFRTALRQTAQRTALLPENAYGAGIVDVEALLRLDLKAIGAVAPAKEAPGDDPGDEMPEEYREIYERFGGATPEAVRLDWRRYGAELGRVALKRAISAEAQLTSLPESAPAGSSSEIRASAEATGDAAMTAWLGASR